MAKRITITEARAAELREALWHLMLRADDNRAARLQVEAELYGLRPMDVPGAKPRSRALSELTARRKESAG